MLHDPGAVITAWVLLALIVVLTFIVIRDAKGRRF